ncbi:putative SUR7 family protein FMP45 [Amylocarpus encephaloides]|uniref:SUR7 family protein FMP45 n=1 Tax=Amylocarpus encephaloides TaxID=45428 RepID=A0A9P7YBH2_9HELO|nr:putative SUR7 family protein FMP45 [Amylocarpus encephaloides]
MGRSHVLTTSTGGVMGTVSLVLIAGSLVLMFFVVLSGVTDSIPLNKTYFLRADTSNVAGARPMSQWTYFYVCGEGNQNCGAAVPDLPFGYAWVGGGDGAPEALLGGHGKSTTSKYYYYMWRFGWVFYLIALFFNVMSFFTALLAPFSRLASGLSAFMVMFALFWFTLAASLMTAVFVKARDLFRSNGQDAHIGRYAFGFTWGAWAAMFLSVIFLLLGCGAGGSSRGESRVPTRTSSGKGGFFSRQRRRGSQRGSFIDNESQRRVKDEYA